MNLAPFIDGSYGITSRFPDRHRPAHLSRATAVPPSACAPSRQEVRDDRPQPQAAPPVSRAHLRPVPECRDRAESLAAFSSTLSYFFSPSTVLAKNPAPGMSFRLGGIVQAGTVTTTITAGTPLTSFPRDRRPGLHPRHLHRRAAGPLPRRPGRGRHRRHDRRPAVSPPMRSWPSTAPPTCPRMSRRRCRKPANGTPNTARPRPRIPGIRMQVKEHELMIPELGHFALALWPSPSPSRKA